MHVFTILFLFYLVCVIPIIYIYIVHGSHEIDAANGLNDNPKKQLRTFAEGYFLLGSGIGYIISIGIIMRFPYSRISYLIILVGTIIIVAVYYFRSVTGVPIPFTDIEIQKISIGMEGLITKILQLVLMIPISMLLMNTWREILIEKKLGIDKS